MKSAGIASQTKLPPSPELQGSNPLHYHSIDELPYLDDTAKTSSRLRSIARYESFKPQALACSTSLTDALGAVAGSKGVAVFRVSKPLAPLMILSHASTFGSTGGAVTSLAFQSDSSRTNYLASARGSGVLVWDVSGHSLSPLWGRLGVDASAGTESDRHITSLAWQPSSGGSPLLAATTASSACLWDLRQSRPSSSSNIFKPSVRFAVARKPGQNAAPYIQVACSGSEECAILDASGKLRVFDTRMTDRTRMSVGSLCSFSACDYAGVGLAFLPGTMGDNWVTWGLDSPAVDSVPAVKIWSKAEDVRESQNEDDGGNGHSLDDYWFVDNSPDKSSSTPSKSIGYGLVSQCSIQNLACARVCPSPVENSLVTIGLEQQKSSSQAAAGWRADLWKVNFSKDVAKSEMEKVVSFSGSGDTAKVLQSVLHRGSEIGSLRAAELAITCSVVDSDEETDYSLLLCSLSDNGLLTTHTIPEAIPEDKRKTSSKAHTVSTGGARNITAPSAKQFPAEQELTLGDAARVWGKQGEPSVSLMEHRDSLERRETPGNTTAAEGGLLPFDMDTPVAYAVTGAGLPGASVGGMKDLVPPNVVTALNAAQQIDKTVGEERDAASLMERIDTDRIPCPRLCGATFGCGVGGLAAFHNGDVRKMWHWWERSVPLRRSSLPSVIGVARSDSKNADEGFGRPETRDCPRTLKDLIEMTAAAKDAQWGERDESEASSAGFRALGDNFFEDDDSDASSASAEGQAAEELADGSEQKNQKRMYDDYFGGHRRPVAQPSSVSQASSDHLDKPGTEEESPAPGPASDLLAPIVHVSHEFVRLALNNQSVELAEGLKLGDLNAVRETLDSKGVRAKELPDDFTGSASVTLPAKQGLPSYRSLLPHPLRMRSNVPTRIRSDPMLNKRRADASERVGIYSDEERGVHGGEYSKGPSMQESVVFRRKLFSHQQPADGENTSIPAFLAPQQASLPNPLLLRKEESSSVLRKLSINKATKGSQIGVYTLREKTVAKSKAGENEEFVRIKENCLQNAEVCRQLGQPEKQEVWETIANLVDNRVARSARGFDGWGGVGGGALGVGLVENFLRFYESLGDVQMLATIVCVLRGSPQTLKPNKGPVGVLLVPDQNERYDTYLRRYADLLYGWKLLTIRAEVNKFLTRTLASIESSGGGSVGKDERVSTPGIALVFKCPQCGGDAEFGNFCRSCRDYAFRCAICDTAVRGLFTVCDSCGHGGHVNHLTTWFTTRGDCPTGCGCNCRLVSPSAQPRDKDNLSDEGAATPLLMSG